MIFVLKTFKVFEFLIQGYSDSGVKELVNIFNAMTALRENHFFHRQKLIKNTQSYYTYSSQHSWYGYKFLPPRKIFNMHENAGEVCKQTLLVCFKHYRHSKENLFVTYINVLTITSI